MKTVFVVGAGASAEVNLPVGSALKDVIAKQLCYRFDFGRLQAGDAEIFEALRLLGADINALVQKARLICEGLPLAISIDNFIDAHAGDRDLELVGKLAIARSILNAEASSSLRMRSRTASSQIDFDSLESTWYVEFWKQLSEGCRPDGLEERLSRVQLVIFNYDRCIEFFLFHAIQRYYQLMADRAAELVRGMRIFHPYGQVGTLPEIERQSGIAFGAQPPPQQLLDIARSLKTFTEGTDESASDILAIRSAIRSADRLVFLGFAYHPQNVQLLEPGEPPGSVIQQVLGTTYDVSAANTRAIKQSLQNKFKPTRLELVDNKCRNFLCDYSRALSYVS